MAFGSSLQAQITAADARPLVFTHIPKCGGSSVRESVRAKLSEQLLAAYRGPERKAVRESLREQLDGKAALFGHFEFSLFEPLIGEARFFTILRDPVERIVSLLAYHRWNESAPYAGMVRDKTDRDALTLLLSHKLPVHNEITRYFGRPGDALAAFQVARRHYDHIGHVVSLDDTFSWLRLEGLSDGEPMKLNATPDPYEVSLEDQAFIRSHVMEDLKLHDMLIGA